MRHLCTLPARYVHVGLLVGALGVGIASCADTGSVDPGPQLAGLSVSGASLQPAFASETSRYSVNLPTNGPSVTVTATKSDPNDVLSGEITSPTGQTAGQATITPPGPGSTKDVSLTVTSPDGRAKVYVITLSTITIGADNLLRSLTVSPGALSPAFSAGTQNYTVDVATDVTEVTVTATKSDPNATISGSLPNQGQATIQLEGPGTSKTVSVLVTAQNGSPNPYSIKVNRALASSNNANLSGLTVNPGFMIPDFNPGGTVYQVYVNNDEDSVTITATKSDPNAVMFSDGELIAGAGTSKGEVVVRTKGKPTLDIAVRAQNGVITKTYTITIIRFRE